MSNMEQKKVRKKLPFYLCPSQKWSQKNIVTQGSSWETPKSILNKSKQFLPGKLWHKI